MHSCVTSAHIYYSNSILKKWFPYPIYTLSQNHAEFSSSRPVSVTGTCCFSSAHTCELSAHSTLSALLGTDWNIITDSDNNSVPSLSCIRLQKQKRTINHWCLSTPYTKETLSTPIHSCSSRAISCWQTRQSVLGRWVVDINAHDIHWVSQSDTWDI